MASESSLDRLLQERSAGSTTPELHSSPIVDESRPTIMIVDDELGMRQALKAIFSSNYQVILAADGMEAIDLFGKHENISCVVTDALMPRMDGFQTAKSLHQMNPDIPVIMLTAHQAMHEPAKVVDFNFKGYVTKGDIRIDSDGRLKLPIIDELERRVKNTCDDYALLLRKRAMNKLKERVMNHLSHELKTPLSVMAANMERISKRLAEAQVTGLEKTLGIAQRNLKRLLRLQDEIDDILSEKSTEEKEHICKIIEGALSFVEYQGDMQSPEERKVLDQLFDFIESIYRVKEDIVETIELDVFLDRICNDAISAMDGRQLEINRDFEKGIRVRMRKEALWKVFSGLLKNAVENTPDEGKVEVSVKAKENEVTVQFRDYGVGITSENQKLIFSGFFHTQDTNLYSSKSPYKFNAGGSGADLLRAMVFSERYGFAIQFESTRCRHIPNDTDTCPGRISRCPFIQDKTQCLSEGGSIFSVKFHWEAGRPN